MWTKFSLKHYDDGAYRVAINGLGVVNLKCINDEWYCDGEPFREADIFYINLPLLPQEYALMNRGDNKVHLCHFIPLVSTVR